MSIAATLEANLRERCQINLPIVSGLIVDDTVQAAPSRSGDLRASIHADDWAEAGDRYLTTVYADSPYAQYQDEGTGEFGPQGAPIVVMPPAGPMTFFWDAVGGWRSLRESRGTSPTRFFDAGPGGNMERRVTAAFIAGWA